jgi:hypothetical protein
MVSSVGIHRGCQAGDNWGRGRASDDWVGDRQGHRPSTGDCTTPVETEAVTLQRRGRLQRKNASAGPGGGRPRSGGSQGGSGWTR